MLHQPLGSIRFGAVFKHKDRKYWVLQITIKQ